MPRTRSLALTPGLPELEEGWQLGLIDLPGPAQRLLCASRANDGSDLAQQALAAEHAAFSYSISHDLRAPISVVEGFGRILKEDYGASLDRIGNDHLDRVMAAAARMNHMIDALLALLRLSTQPLARQPVNLSQLAGFVVDELRRGGRGVYVVRDNGAGFDMRFADRLFGVFQRLHSASDFAGNGVGLASVRRIVRRHGGEIWAESEVGQGARFFFTLKD